MVASVAATLYRVVTVKRGEVTWSQSTTAWMATSRPALSNQRFDAAIVHRLDAADDETVSVVGRQSESGDVLVEVVRSPASRAADLPGAPATGAYCCPMANNDMRNRRIPVV